MTVNNILSNHQVFSTLNHTQVEAILQAGSSMNFKKDEVITHAGDIWPYLFIVISGSIMAVKESSEGRSLIAEHFNTGDLFWGLAFFQDNAPMPASLVAHKASRLYLWSLSQLKPFILANGPFSWELSRLMVTRLLRASEILEEIAFQPVAGRLARLLINLYQQENNPHIERGLTLDEMAARINSTREMVCRLLHRFSEDQAIDITRTTFRIRDVGALEKYTENIK